MESINLNLEVFHLDISGNDINEVHSKNKDLIPMTLEVSHLDISGNDTNKLHS